MSQGSRELGCALLPSCHCPPARLPGKQEEQKHLQPRNFILWHYFSAPGGCSLHPSKDQAFPAYPVPILCVFVVYGTDSHHVRHWFDLELPCPAPLQSQLLPPEDFPLLQELCVCKV